jgi:prepilin signal peptidase PulO-like enzyme (type II secretory pathway)
MGMEVVVYLALILLGACLGSFAGAQVWRLRARQLVEDKRLNLPVDTREYKKLRGLAATPVHKDHSHCLHCGYELKWYDLIPIVSWLSLGGKCRQCRKPIGWFELLMEIGVAAFFAVSYWLWPFALDTTLEITRFVIWLVAGVVMAMLIAYDAKWFLLPDKLTVILAALGVMTVAITAQQSGNLLMTLGSAAIAVGILSGLYLGLFLLSRGKWVGFGDIKLNVGLALLLVDWQLALVALFLANLIGCLVVIPLMAAKKLGRQSRVPFGPFLILGMIVAQFAGPSLLLFYVGTLI